jgi:hypothetical protein
MKNRGLVTVPEDKEVEAVSSRLTRTKTHRDLGPLISGVGFFNQAECRVPKRVPVPVQHPESKITGISHRICCK